MVFSYTWEFCLITWNGNSLDILFFLKIIFICLTERDIVGKGTQAREVGEEEGLNREPDAGLEPRTLGS